MKKLFVLLMALLMVLTLAGCGNNTTDEPVVEDDKPSYDANAVDISTLKLANLREYTYADNSELANMDYTVTALASDHEINTNLVDGLVECDSYGNYIGSIAESWESNADGTVWTFHLRKGAKWVTAAGEEYAEVVADDFVTGLRHGAEFVSGTAYVATAVKGYSDYMANGDYSDDAWEKVGIKAVDDYTVEFTLKDSTPYFYTQVEYSTFYPINKTFLESKGNGCKLGSPDVNDCQFGAGATPDAILYNGAFILSSFDVQSSTVLKANPAYWDAANVKLDKITVVYDTGSDPYSTIRGFEQNIYAAAGLSTSWGDEVFKQFMSKYDGYVTTSIPNCYAYGVVFNYNRLTWDHTNYGTTAIAQEKSKAAIRNENVRLALKAAFDVPAYLAVTAPTDVANATIRNMNGVPNLVTTSNGTPYVTLVEDAYAELTGTKVSLADGQWPWLSKDNALAYIEKAKSEGVEFPVHLDMLVNGDSDAAVKKAQSMKNSIEANTDGNIIIELVIEAQDVVDNIAYYSESWSEADYDISTFTGWGPDYVDPKTFTEIYSPVDGYYMHSCGLTDKGSTASPDFNFDWYIKEYVGFNEYEELYRAADAIKGDLDARYAAFAKADAYLLAKGLYVPTSQQTRSVRVSHIVPFTVAYSTGISQYKLKGLQLQEGIVTKEQYDAAYANWAAGGK